MSGDPIRLLLVPTAPRDASGDALFLRRLFRAHEDAEGASLQLEQVDALEAGLERVHKRDVDAVLLDASGPGGVGPEAVRRLRECDVDLPIVVRIAAGNEAGVPRLLRAGAQDCVVKDGSESGAQLARSVRHAIERQRIAQEERALRRHLVQSEHMASLGVLCAGMGFGLSQLVGAVLEQIDAASDALKEAEGESQPRRDLRRHLLTTRKTALRAAALSDRLRDYAGEQRAAPHALDLSAFVLDASASLDAVAGGVPIHYDVPSGGPVVVAGRLPLYQILVGLVRNAAEALEPARGHIAVSTGVRRVDAEIFETSLGAPQLAPGVHAFLRVADDGRGMAPDVAERIFDPFFSTKCAGRGLGLSAALGIVRALQGRIHVRTGCGTGSAFTVFLPLA